MFWIGALPALLALYIRTKVPESEAWKQHRAASTGQVLRIVAGEWKRFSYLVVLMTFMMFLSHGTQDLYPDFLKEVHKISSAMVANIAMIYNVGAGRDRIWTPLASGRAPQRHDRGFGIVALDDSAVGVWQGPPRNSRGDISDAGGSARSLGRDPGAPE